MLKPTIATVDDYKSTTRKTVVLFGPIHAHLSQLARKLGRPIGQIVKELVLRVLVRFEMTHPMPTARRHAGGHGRPDGAA